MAQGAGEKIKGGDTLIFKMELLSINRKAGEAGSDPGLILAFFGDHSAVLLGSLIWCEMCLRTVPADRCDPTVDSSGGPDGMIHGTACDEQETKYVEKIAAKIDGDASIIKALL